MKSDYGEGFLKQKFRKKSKVVKAMVTLNADSENKEEEEIDNEGAEDKQKTLIKDLDAEEYDEQHMLASKVSGLIRTLSSPAEAGQSGDLLLASISAFPRHRTLSYSMAEFLLINAKSYNDRYLIDSSFQSPWMKN